MIKRPETSTQIIAVTVQISRADIVRERLDDMARLRREHEEADKEIARGIRALIAEAREVGISMSEVARRLKIDRTGLYRTYIDG